MNFRSFATGTNGDGNAIDATSTHITTNTAMIVQKSHPGRRRLFWWAVSSRTGAPAFCSRRQATQWVPTAACTRQSGHAGRSHRVHDSSVGTAGWKAQRGVSAVTSLIGCAAGEATVAGRGGAEREGFEPSIQVTPGYPLSRRALSASQPPLRVGRLSYRSISRIDAEASAVDPEGWQSGRMQRS